MRIGRCARLLIYAVIDPTRARRLFWRILRLGNDTGPVFLAAKTGAPTLMIMGPDTDPTMSAPNGIAASWLRANPISDITVTAALTSLYKLQ